MERGCERIAMLCDSDVLSSYREMLRGAEQAHDEAGRKLARELVYPTDFLRTPRAIDLLESALSHGGLPFEGLFCCSYRLTLGALSVFKKHQIQMPRDVRLVGFGEMRIWNYGLLQFTVIAEHSEDVAYAAVDELVRLIRDHDGTYRQISKGVVFRQGETT